MGCTVGRKRLEERGPWRQSTATVQARGQNLWLSGSSFCFLLWAQRRKNQERCGPELLDIATWVFQRYFNINRGQTEFTSFPHDVPVSEFEILSHRGLGSEKLFPSLPVFQGGATRTVHPTCTPCLLCPFLFVSHWHPLADLPGVRW